ncbi:MAG: MCP four helix bundle domain-containing protein, partial [Solirubrobacterales bacterium]
MSSTQVGVLGNAKIIVKLLLLIGVMSAVTAIISAVGVHNIGQLSSMGAEIQESGKEALTGARLNQEVIRLNRGEFRIAANPSVDEMREVEKLMDGQRKSLEDKLATLKTTADDKQAELLAEVDKNYQAYLVELRDTLGKARQHGNQVSNNEAQKIIIDAAIASRAAAKRLEDSVIAYNNFADEKSHKLAQEAADNAAAVQKLMIVVAALGVVGGLGIGLAIGNYGISRPISFAVDCLRRLANGDTEVQVFGVGRKDEIGQIAETMQVFKDNLIAKIRMEAEQRAAEEAQRKAEAEQRAREAAIVAEVAEVAKAASEGDLDR